MATPETTTTKAATAHAKETFSPPATIQHSQWLSPMPYLFGGLAAMLGLIAFALLLLACSYGTLSDQVNRIEDGDERYMEAGIVEKGDGSSDTNALPVFEEKILVVMAGDVKPTFLATPSSGRASSSFIHEKTNDKDKENEKSKNQNHTEVKILENGEEPQESNQEEIQT